MELHYKEFGEGRPLIILHGLFGSSDNWISIAKHFSTYFKVYLIDLRNHGHSAWSDSHTYEEMSDDIYEWAIANGISEMNLLGHSMGGKVAMKFSQNYPHLINKLVVVDMGIKAYPMHHQNILSGIHNLDLHKIQSRGEANDILAIHIESEGVRQFLLKNLYWIEKGKLAWRMNTKILEEFMPEILSELPNQKVSIPTLFIRGELSNYILDSDFTKIEMVFSNCKFETILDAGHWVHAEQTNDFCEKVLEFISVSS